MLEGVEPTQIFHSLQHFPLCSFALVPEGSPLTIVYFIPLPSSINLVAAATIYGQSFVCRIKNHFGDTNFVSHVVADQDVFPGRKSDDHVVMFETQPKINSSALEVAGRDETQASSSCETRQRGSLGLLQLLHFRFSIRDPSDNVGPVDLAGSEHNTPQGWLSWLDNRVSPPSSPR